MSCRNLWTFRRNALFLYFERQRQKTLTSELSVPFTIPRGVTFRNSYLQPPPCEPQISYKYALPPKRPFSAISSWWLMCLLSANYISNVPDRLQLKPHEKYRHLNFHILPAWYFNHSWCFSIYFSLFFGNSSYNVI